MREEGIIKLKMLWWTYRTGQIHWILFQRKNAIVSWPVNQGIKKVAKTNKIIPTKTNPYKNSECLILNFSSKIHIPDDNELYNSHKVSWKKTALQFINLFSYIRISKGICKYVNIRIRLKSTRECQNHSPTSTFFF